MAFQAVCLLVYIVCTASTMPVFTDKPVYTDFGPTTDADDGNEAQLDQLIKNLGKEQDLQKEAQRKQATIVNNYIKENLPWIEKKKHMVNYFTKVHKNVEDTSKYGDGAAVLLAEYHPHISDLVKCMQSAILLETEGVLPNNYHISPMMSHAKRARWDLNKIHHDDETRNKFKMHHGEAVFGICDDITRPCSYLTILQDPMQRAVNSYRACQLVENKDIELCQVVSAKDVSLRDWIIHQSDYLLHYFVFKSDLCRHNSTNTFSNSHLPCWYKHTIYYNKMTDRDKSNMVDYVVNNLEKWFSVIGLYDDLENSLLMFEHVYQMPFQLCMKVNQKTGKIANKVTKTSTRTSYDENDDLELLKYDTEVQQAMDADMLIYKRAKDIYKIQKQLLLNKIGR